MTKIYVSAQLAALQEQALRDVLPTHHRSVGGRGPWEEGDAGARGQEGRGTRAGKETSGSGPAAVQQLPSHVTAGGPSHLLRVSIARHTVKQR